MRERRIRRFGEDLLPHSSRPGRRNCGHGSTAVDRLVKVLWKMNRELPRYFMTQPGRWLISDNQASIPYHAHSR